MADSCGPYRAALSYNSKSGTAKSFIFLGTVRTSIGGRKRVQLDNHTEQYNVRHGIKYTYYVVVNVQQRAVFAP
jgi:hypothetical protein